ncbi:MAG: DNA ligase D [Gammaproteobacteria bacterium]|nr:DNA ligase D [Gammaproteobacteria bacterium]
MAARKPDDLSVYRAKRKAGATPEPFSPADPGATATRGGPRAFVVQQHQASHLHWDVRLEIDGVLRSWAVPKGPSPDPADKRFAALVEDHPLDYADFEGRIPDGNYGAGYVIVWDRGTYVELEPFDTGFERGKLLFELRGHKLRGRWTLVRMQGPRQREAGDGKEWLLIKERDEWAREVPPANDSVLSGLTLEDMPDPAVVERRLAERIRAIDPVPPETGPLEVKPMLARSGEAFDRDGWVFEIKYDGYRLMIEKDGDRVTLRSRRGLVLTANFPEVEKAARRLPFSQFVIDGEAVVHDASGIPSFSLLQQRARLRGSVEVSRALNALPVTYYAFDLPQSIGHDLRGLPLLARKELLQAMLPSTGPVRYSEHIEGSGIRVFEHVQSLGLEGVVGKRADSPYRAGRSDTWVKVRTERTGDFVIAGWAPNKSNAADIGALALAEYRGAELTFCGRVGAGLNVRARKDIGERLQDLAPADALADDREVRWVTPTLVCEVAYKEYTLDGRLRQPAFRRLRDDKPPTDCIGHFEDPSPVEVESAVHHTVTVTNRDKVFFPEKDLTKGHLVDYYERIAPWMLPYLRDRPLVLTRFPDGIHGKSFYQRDAPDFVPDWVKRTALWTETEERDIRYFMVEDAASLKYLANMGAIPIHAWHSRIDRLEHPDWCVLDLDPKDAPFADVIAVAKETRVLLDEIELPGYLKTSGASGLHILVPLARRLTHDQSRTLGELLARVVVTRLPEICTIVRAVRKRESKVYIDYMQNRHGQLIVAPFSARAEPAASVSMPLRWSELNGRLSNARHHIENAVARMKRNEDPMLPVLTDEPDLGAALARLAELVVS